MRGHGFTVTGKTIEEAVYQAYYTQEAAKTQTTALVTRSAYFGEVVEGKVDVEGGGKIKGGKVKTEGSLHHLSDKEGVDAWGVNREGLGMAWKVWAKEVECIPLYRNELGK
jgi:ribulose-5-phosphate 4-epimerase/fuculose-1-phosphate aldolase